LKWFRDKIFRQAIACSLNRDRLVKEACAGRALATYGLISSDNQQWNNPAIPRFGNDPEKARTLLAEIGIQDRNSDGILEDPDGQPAGFTLLSNSENAARAKMAALIAEDLRRAGFQVNVQLVDFPTLVQKVSATFDYECALMGFGGGGDEPASQINLLKSDETLHQWFPRQPAPSTAWEARMNWLMDAQMRTLDQAGRKKLFDEVQLIWAEELPMISLIAPFASAAARPNLANIRPAANTAFPLTWNIEELFFKPPAGR
jgi:peptide/nickel transport system substrate-binding protein